MSFSRCARACSITSRGCAVASPAQSRNVERNPCTVRSARFIRLSSCSPTMLDNGLPARPGKSRTPSCWPRSRTSSAIAASDNGMRCSFPAFMREAGIVHKRASRSNSDQLASSASDVRQAVKMHNSTSIAPAPGMARSCGMKAGSSRQSSAAWFSTFATALGFGNSWSRCPRHAAGLSPARNPCTVHHARMPSIRPRSLVAVSVLSRQIGSSTRITCSVLTSATGMAPSTGLA